MQLKIINISYIITKAYHNLLRVTFECVEQRCSSFTPFFQKKNRNVQGTPCVKTLLWNSLECLSTFWLFCTLILTTVFQPTMATDTSNFHNMGRSLRMDEAIHFFYTFVILFFVTYINKQSKMYKKSIKEVYRVVHSETTPHAYWVIEYGICTRILGDSVYLRVEKIS